MNRLRDLIVLVNFLDEESITTASLIENAERVGLSGNLFRSYIIYKLAHEPNLISTTIERADGRIGESLIDAFKHDLKILFDRAENFMSPYDFLKNYTPTVKNNSESFNELANKLENLRGSDVDKIVEIFIAHSVSMKLRKI